MSLIDDYLKKVEPSKRKQLERIRVLAKEIVPSAKETISYNMPTLKYDAHNCKTSFARIPSRRGLFAYHWIARSPSGC